MKPCTPYIFKKKTVSKKLDNGEKVQYNEVKLKRRKFNRYILASVLFGLFMVRVVRYSRFWYFGAFAPAILMKITDSRLTDYSEIENFYKYVDERRRGEYLQKLNSASVSKAISTTDNSAVIELKDELSKHNKTVYDVTADLEAAYLNGARELLQK
jgi:hypothetical protein